MRQLLLGLITLAGVTAPPAHALCSSASLGEDYRQADVVVRARVVAQTRVDDDAPGPAYRARWGEYSPVTLQRLTVSEVFKGRPGPSVNLFEEVDSGRFGADFGEEYLLFLSYHPPSKSRGREARGAMHVRYTCGLSKRWSEVRATDLSRLRAMRQ